MAKIFIQRIYSFKKDPKLSIQRIHSFKKDPKLFIQRIYSFKRIQNHSFKENIHSSEKLIIPHVATWPRGHDNMVVCFNLLESTIDPR